MKSRAVQRAGNAANASSSAFWNSAGFSNCGKCPEPAIATASKFGWYLRFAARFAGRRSPLIALIGARVALSPAASS